jgi:hypothetical protein
MMSWAVYVVSIATTVSVVGLSRIVIKEHDYRRPRTLSELAVAEQALLRHFRNILLFCGALFAVVVFGFVVPLVNHSSLVAASGAFMIGGELLAIVPARNKTAAIHTVTAQVMAVGMLGLVFLFGADLGGVYRYIEMVFACMMSASVILTAVDKSRFMIYELAFIFVSHFSILVATIALS